MKTKHVLTGVLVVTLSATVWAEAPKMKIDTEVPEGIATPDCTGLLDQRIDHSFGILAGDFRLNSEALCTRTGQSVYRPVIAAS